MKDMNKHACGIVNAKDVKRRIKQLRSKAHIQKLDASDVVNAKCAKEKLKKLRSRAQNIQNKDTRDALVKIVDICLLRWKHVSRISIRHELVQWTFKEVRFLELELTAAEYGLLSKEADKAFEKAYDQEIDEAYEREMHRGSHSRKGSSHAR